MQLSRRQRQFSKGDTLIEVMFAFSIFALVAVGSLTVMNQGIATAQRSLEITLVRAQMDAQAETIRYIHQAYVAAYQKDGPVPSDPTAVQWVKMTSKTTGKGADQASTYGAVDGLNCPAMSSIQHPFIVNTHTARVEDSAPQSTPPADGSLPPFSQVRYHSDSTVDQAYGIWVEAVPSTTNNGTGFVDFHIRTCWTGAGIARPMTLGTIVRLYEPR